MKPLVLYHANCADGFGAAFATWTVLGDEAEYVPVKYNEDYSKTENTFIVTDRELYILDFSFPRDIMDMMFAKAAKVVWLDHHKTAFEMWGVDPAVCSSHTDKGGKHHIELINNKSGALLAWEYFHPDEEVPLLFQHLDDYDRWQFKIEGTKAFSKAVWSYTPWSFEQWNDWLDDGESDEALYALYREGKAILRAHDQNVQSVVKGAARKCEVKYSYENPVKEYDWHWIGLAANCPPHLTSDVGHELADQSGTFGLCWTLGKKDGLIASCSLRSNGDYDVSAIAKCFGGGGHKNAAGFEVPIETLLSWL